MFVIDVGYHKIAIRSQEAGHPVVGVVDTNHNPDGIDYVIPGNDDSAKAVALYARACGRRRARRQGQRDRRSGAGRLGRRDEFVEVETTA